jgi:Tfp pilus assembly protein FimV
LSALSAALLSTTQAWAIGFGDIVLHSRIGEPLRAEVPINAEADEQLETTCFSLAPLNGSDLPVISGAKTKLVREGNRYRLHITGSKPISEPVFLIGLRAGCGVDLQRDYVLMPAEPLVLASPPPAGTSVGAPTAAGGTRSRGAAIQEWRANEGDTLEGIAETLVPDNLAQQRRMLAALKRANPQLSGRPALADGTAVVIPDVKQRLSAERDTLPPQETKPRSEPPPPPPPPPAPKVAKPAAPPKASGVDRVVLGDPPAEIKPGEKAAPPKGSKAELDERMLKMEATIQLLHTQIEALDKALALTAETLTLQQKLQAAQAATGALPAPVAKPAEPPPPAPSNSNWLEVLLSALAGGAIAGGLAHILGRRRDRRPEDERPLPAPQERHPVKPAPAALAETPPTKPAVAADAPAIPATAAALDVPLDAFSRAPTDLKPVEVRFDQDDSAIALAEIMLSFGRPQGAAETLARHIEESASDNPRPWLMLLDLYRRGGLSGEYTRLLPALRQKFNLQVPAWQDLQTPVSGLKSLEDYEHVASRVTAIWGTQECMDYLYKLVHDNRAGQRSGFPLEVVEEIVLLLLVLEAAYGLQRQR